MELNNNDIIELSQKECEEIFQYALHKVGNNFNNLPIDSQLNAVIGLIATISAMQALGYKIIRLMSTFNDSNPLQ